MDVALRIDLASARRALGPDVARELRFHTADEETDPVTSRFFGAVLDRADAVWIGFRPGLAPESTDNVVVARGRFAGLDPKQGAGHETWSGPTDLGGDVRRYDRKPPRRAAPARLYAVASDVWIFVSEAEIDSTERAVERRLLDPKPDPPERGTVSIAARIQPMLRFLEPKFSAVARLFESATELHGHATVDVAGLVAELDVQFVDDVSATESAAQSARLFEELGRSRGPWGLVARRVSPEAVASTVVFRARFEPEEVGQLAQCLVSGPGCE